LSILSATDEGWLLDAFGNRMIAFEAETFQAFVGQLMEVAGKQVGTVLLFAMGLRAGKLIFKHRKPESGSEKELSSALDSSLRSRGWGRCINVAKNAMAQTSYLVSITGTPLSHNRRSEEPTCHFIRGVVAGWFEEYLGMRLECMETKCMSMGVNVCAFQLKLLLEAR